MVNSEKKIKILDDFGIFFSQNFFAYLRGFFFGCQVAKFNPKLKTQLSNLFAKGVKILKAPVLPLMFFF
jgi:hypothetical protein